jgi:ABC-2 type transport system permease protein
MLFRMLSQWWKRRGGGAAAVAAADANGATAQPSIEHGARQLQLELSNVVAVAHREYVVRARTRTFRLTTVLLVFVALGVSLAPLLFRWLDRNTGPTVVEVSIGDSNPAANVPLSVGATLNADPLAGVGGAAASPAPSTAPAPPKYVVNLVTDPEAAKTRVADGKSAGLLVVTRDATTKDLAFQYVTNDGSITDRVAAAVRQAATIVAQQDQLTRFGLTREQMTALDKEPTYDVVEATPGSTGPPKGVEALISGQVGGFVLAIVIFMAIILYGQWIAYSVAEEKSSRVMEVILGAASPFDLLAGKVVGVGALALTQYAVVFLPAALAIVFQDQIAGLLLGTQAASAALPTGLSLPLLLGFGVFFILGFALYATLYAGAAALVSRTEDINQIIAPMTLLSTAGYLVAVWSATGILAPDSKLVTVMSFIPFFSPYLMLTRLGAGAATPVQVAASLAILAVSIPVALWVASRFYAAGVLMYGQRPSIRLFMRVLRGA